MIARARFDPGISQAKSAISRLRPGSLWPIAGFVLIMTSGCNREDREYRDGAPGASALPAVRTSGLEAGPSTADPTIEVYQDNRWAVSQGQMLYSQFNCAGCHSLGGGGGMGPPLID